MVHSITLHREVFPIKEVKLEAVLLLPEGIVTSSLVAVIDEALRKLPDADKIKIKKLIFE